MQYLNWNFAVTLLVMGSFVPFPVNWAPSRTGLNLLIFRRFDSSLGWPLTGPKNGEDAKSSFQLLKWKLIKISVLAQPDVY